MQKHSSEQGFTLIELIVVIVILGILAAFAIPRFINLQNDARRSVLQGISGSLQAAQRWPTARPWSARLSRRGPVAPFPSLEPALTARWPWHMAIPPVPASPPCSRTPPISV
ncbi:MAG: type IV pilin protein [Acidithiobacillus ferrooxidans]